MAIVLIVAAGKSTRFGSNKLFHKILNKPLLFYTIRDFQNHPGIKKILLVTDRKNLNEVKKMVLTYHFSKVKEYAFGGKERQDSVFNGLKKLEKCSLNDVILIHNGASPLVTFEEISAVIKAAKKYGAAAMGRSLYDTLAEKEGDFFSKTLQRDKIVGLRTPQAAKYQLFKKAFQKAKQDKKNFTDESSLLQYAGVKVYCVPASEQNFKVTIPLDFECTKNILTRLEQENSQYLDSKQQFIEDFSVNMPQGFCVGFGQDSHGFLKNKKGLWLGGYLLKDEFACDADSDGDVLLHAFCNALSQALGEKSLGSFATAMFERGITKSSVYLKNVLKKVKQRDYVLSNVGFMIEGKRPKIDPVSDQIKKSLSKLTGLPLEKIGITATTGEKLTSFGKGEGLQCFAIVGLVKK